MPEDGDGTTYALYFRETEGRFLLRFKYEGVTLLPDRMTWTADGPAEEPYSRIESITLTVAYVARSGPVAACRILFSDLRTLSVASSSAAGTFDDQRNETYGSFIRDLHSRLTEADRKRIRFHAGNSAGRQTAGRIVMAIAAAFFLILPLGLFFLTREWKALGLTLAGAAFLWPLWTTLRKNRPREYDPAHLDADVFP